MATYESTEYTNIFSTNPAEKVDAWSWGGRLRVAHADYTQASTATTAETVAMVKLPPGKVRLLKPLSHIYTSGTGTSGVVDVGWEAYTDPDGVAVAADPNGLADALDVATAGMVSLDADVGTEITKEFTSRDGVVVTLQFTGNVIDVNDTVEALFVYVND